MDEPSKGERRRGWVSSSTHDGVSSRAAQFAKYLAVKKSVDDRSLNERIWRMFSELVAGIDHPKVLEPACGIGTMLERLIERGALTSAEYRGLDLEGEYVELAQLHLSEWAANNGHSAVRSGDELLIESPSTSIAARFDRADVLEYDLGSDPYDVLIAHSFLDLVDIPTTLDRLMAGLTAGGVFYFTLVFDGLTVLEPEIDAELDRELMRRYHDTMDRRIVDGSPSGDSRSGRHLFGWLKQTELELLEAGSSDWVVYPRAGQYSTDEFEFLSHMLETIRAALDAPEVEHWFEQREAQLEAGELIYIAHQMDFLGRKASATS